MSLRRAMLAMILALAWCGTALHQDLEATGWMLEHDHHLPAHHQAEAPSSLPQSLPTNGDHEPVWARGQIQDGRIAVVVQGVLAVVVLFLLTLPGVRLLRLLTEGLPVLSGGPPPLDPVWSFVRRCAPDVAAPPALN